MRNNRRLQSGQQGELAAEKWFVENGWQMIRTQPAIRILGSKPGARYGRIFTVCMVGRGGVPDYTGWYKNHVMKWDERGEKLIPSGDGFIPTYRAVEVKEAHGNSCPASRLDREQREFMKSLPEGCAFVGVWFVDHQRFEIFPFKERGAYKKERV